MPNRDQLLTALNEEGFVPVFIPRAGLQPPELYTVKGNGGLGRLGPLDQYLKPGARPFTVARNPASNMLVKHTSKKDIAGSASFLAKALACIGITSAPKLKLDFAGSDSFIFAFEGVTIASVDAAAIQRNLEFLDLSRVPTEDIDQKRRPHVAYEYLCAQTLLLYRSDLKNFSCEITGANLEQFIDVGIKGAVEAQSSSVIRFHNTEEPAPFAYKSGGLVWRGNKWWFSVNLKPTQNAVGTGETGPARPYLPALGVVLSAVD